MESAHTGSLLPIAEVVHTPEAQAGLLSYLGFPLHSPVLAVPVQGG